MGVTRIHHSKRICFCLVGRSERLLENIQSRSDDLLAVMNGEFIKSFDHFHDDLNGFRLAGNGLVYNLLYDSFSL